MGIPYAAIFCFSRNRVKIWKFVVIEPPSNKPEPKVKEIKQEKRLPGDS
jgi:hypothetical protein